MMHVVFLTDYFGACYVPTEAVMLMIAVSNDA